MAGASGHWVKPAVRCTLPQVVFALVCRPAWDAGRRSGGVRVARWYQATCAVSYRRRGGWTAPQDVLVTTPDALREWMGARALAGRVNWVIAPSASEALTLSGWWDYAQSQQSDGGGGREGAGGAGGGSGSARGVRIDTVLTGHRAEIVEWADGGTRWRWLSERNYWPDGRHDPQRGIEAAQSDGGHRISGGDAGRGGDAGGCRALLTRLTGLCAWWRRVATAPFGRTAGQLAVGVLRSHIPARSLCTHSDADVHRIERASAHGGRASVWYSRAIPGPDVGRAADGLGRVPEDRDGVRGPITRYDVSAMYPALLRDERYPVALRGMVGPMPVARLLDMARDWGVIATVDVRVHRAEYPYRRKEMVVYPTGEFQTTLAGPDLLALSEDGEILRVHRCAYYTLGTPFRDAMESLLAERAECRERGDTDGETFAKLLACSVGGKMAQRQGKWVRRSALDCPGRWGERWELSEGTATRRRLRFVSGLCHEWDETSEPRGPHTAAFAYLTAHGRQQMRRIRMTLPECAVVSQDTDGLYALPSAAARMTAAGILERAAPGRLRRVASADSGHWWGPRHYRYGEAVVMSGLACPVVDSAQSSVTWTSHTPLFAQRNFAAPDSVVTITRRGPIPCDIGHGVVQSDGWIRPYHVWPGRRYDEELQ